MRAFDTAFGKGFLPGYQAGVMRFRYRGLPCHKSPIDLAIYSEALWQLRPRTVIEIGSKAGGSALWLADQMQAFGLDATIDSIDLEPPVIEDPRITFRRGDVIELETVLAQAGLLTAPHPWFVTEDSAHSYEGCRVALEVCGRYMHAGDLLVMEDGVLDELGLSDRYQGGPNRAIAEYLAGHPEVFEIDTALCDMFGRNATYAPNGYLRRR